MIPTNDARKTIYTFFSFLLTILLPLSILVAACLLVNDKYNPDRRYIIPKNIINASFMFVRLCFCPISYRLPFKPVNQHLL